MKKFIDVSNNQGNINLEAVVKNNGLDMVIIKSSEGIGWEDPQFENYYNKLKKLNVKIGFYHFSRFDDARNDPIEEANSFLNITNGKKADVYVLDYETGAAGRNARDLCKKFMDRVKSKVGNKVWLYSYENEFKTQNLADAGYDNWVANYGTNNGTAQTKPDTKNLVAWQYTSVGKLSGYNGNLDLNYGYYTENNESDVDIDLKENEYVLTGKTVWIEVKDVVLSDVYLAYNRPDGAQNMTFVMDHGSYYAFEVLANSGTWYMTYDDKYRGYFLPSRDVAKITKVIVNDSRYHG